MQIVAITMQYIFWEYKLKKRFPTYIGYKMEFFYLLVGMDKCTNLLGIERNKINFLLCRNWNELRNGS